MRKDFQTGLSSVLLVFFCLFVCFSLLLLLLLFCFLITADSAKKIMKDSQA